ncbi:MAG: hypothetical protein U0441_05855 [Polyangiaceae bacterium]
MQTRTKNAIAAAALIATIGFVVFAVQKTRTPAGLRSAALDAIPQGAIVVAVADLAALRASPEGKKMLESDRNIPGLGTVREVCGFDPMERVGELAIVVPAGGDEGDFGLVAAGQADDEPILACASKVIEARGGRPVITNVGSFRTVRDATMILSGAEIAVKKGGPILLGAGPYLRAMIDAADGRIPTIRTSVAHARLSELVEGSALRATIVLTPKQREDLAQNLAEGGGPKSAASILAAAVGVKLGPMVVLKAVIACEDPASCADVARILTKAKDERAADVTTRIVGFSKVLEDATIKAQGESIEITAQAPADQALPLLERLLVLRGVRHPTAGALPSGAESAPPPPPSGAPDALPGGVPDAGSKAGVALPPPDEVLTAKGDAGAPPRDAGAHGGR